MAWVEVAMAWVADATSWAEVVAEERETEEAVRAGGVRVTEVEVRDREEASVAAMAS